MTVEKAREIVTSQETELYGNTRNPNQTVMAEYSYVYAKGYLECHKQVEWLVEAAKNVVGHYGFVHAGFIGAPSAGAVLIDWLSEALKPFLPDEAK